MKTCSICNHSKEHVDFNKSSKSSDGLQSACRDCRKQYNKIHTLKYGKAKYASINGRAKALISQAKIRAKAKGLEFNLVWEHVAVLLTIGKCQKSGIEFDFSSNRTGFRNLFAPSLDRKDNNKGYSPDNIQIVCNMYNIGKGQHTDEEFISFCRKVAEFNK